MQLASLSLDGLRKRSQELAGKIKTHKNMPARTKEMKYHAPLSREVQGEELFFECRSGKVAFIDMPAFLHEVRENTEEVAKLLRKEYKVRRVTAPVGAFRLQYFFEREGGLMDASASRFSLPLWPVGWSSRFLARAAAKPCRRPPWLPASDFHRIADAIDPNQTAVTFWVYPDSFAIFRALRDYLYDRDVEVAGRPLPTEAPIAASRNGTKSRGQ